MMVLLFFSRLWTVKHGQAIFWAIEEFFLDGGWVGDIMGCLDESYSNCNIILQLNI
jgi:hypothetical protein